jgi:hypothetical protein
VLPRVLAILLMLAVPLEGFAVSHVHGTMAGMQPDDHDPRPHLHLGDHHHHHAHSHGDGRSHGDGHSHGPGPCDDQGEEQNVSQPEAPTQPSNHEADALYVSGDLGLNLTHAAPTVVDMGLVVWTKTVSLTGVDARSSIDAAPHFSARGDTPIYLTTLSLRL